MFLTWLSIDMISDVKMHQKSDLLGYNPVKNDSDRLKLVRD